MDLLNQIQIDGIYTLSRPIAIAHLSIALIAFIILLFPKGKQVVFNGYSVIGLAVVLSVLSYLLFLNDFSIVDELGLGGDGFTTICSFGTVILSVINVIIYAYRHMERREIQ